RLANREELAGLLQAVLSTQGSDVWLEAVSAAGIPVGPVHDLGEALAHPVTQERKLIAPAADGRIADLLQIHLPMDRERSAPRRQAPGLGEHTESVLTEAGFTPDEVAAIVDAPTARTKGPKIT